MHCMHDIVHCPGPNFFFESQEHAFITDSSYLNNHNKYVYEQSIHLLLGNITELVLYFKQNISVSYKSNCHRFLSAEHKHEVISSILHASTSYSIISFNTLRKI